MTHVGQEFALGAVGGFRRLLGRQHGHLGGAASGDIDEGDHGAYDLALPFNGIRPIFGGKTRSVGSPHDFRVVVTGLTGAKRLTRGTI